MTDNITFAAAAQMDASDMVFVSATITISRANTIRAIGGQVNRSTPKEEETPFPPLKPKNTGQLWPITQAMPAI